MIIRKVRKLEFIYILLAIFLGQISRVVFPYLHERWTLYLEKGEKLEFDFKYLYRAIREVIIKFVMSLPILILYEPVTIYGDIAMFAIAFAFGYDGLKFAGDMKDFIRKGLALWRLMNEKNDN